MQAFEEVVDGHVERDGEFVKTRRRNAVRTAFVFLDLLEANADGLSQLLLGEAQKPATAAKPLADMEVDGVSHCVAPLIRGGSPTGPAFYAKRERARSIPRETGAIHPFRSVNRQ